MIVKTVFHWVDSTESWIVGLPYSIQIVFVLLVVLPCVYYAAALLYTISLIIIPDTQELIEEKEV